MAEARKIVVFYHALLALGDPPELLPAAVDIICEQMDILKRSGLEDAASEIHIGINGLESTEESHVLTSMLFTSKANIVLHPMTCRNELRTILLLEKWLNENKTEAYILFSHSKGASHPANDPMRTRWRKCMENTVIWNWRQCVADLDAGFEAVGVHYMIPPATPPGQFIFAGNFWWSRTDFLKTLPSVMERDRIKVSGIDSIESRYESEVWIGNGPRPPKVKDYHGPNWNPGQLHTCKA